MTPLAHAIVKDSLVPPHKKVWSSTAAPPDLCDVHCFDCTQVSTIAYHIGGKKVQSTKLNDDATAILPADKIWIEYMVTDDDEILARIGILVERSSDTTAMIRTYIRLLDETRIMPFGVDVKIPLYGHRNDESHLIGNNISMGTNAQIITTTLGCLAIINTPRAFLRRDHSPHKGLARALKADGRKAPENKWSEIILDFDPDFSGEKREASGRLTGAKAYHYCRAHLRIKNGKLERVRGHMRGDPSLGTVQSHYRLRGPRTTSCSANGGT